MGKILTVDKLRKVELTKVKVFYEILTDISFSIDESSINFIYSQNERELTSLLKIVSGLDAPASGEIKFAGKPVSENKTRIIYISDNYFAFPWLNVKQNITLSDLEYGDDKQKLFERIIKITGLSGYENYLPRQPKSGLSLRAAIGRAIFAGAGIIILNNSLMTLSEITINEIFAVLNAVKSEFNISFIIGTNTPHSICQYAEKILFLRSGELQDELMITEGLTLKHILAKIDEIYFPESVNIQTGDD